MYPTEPFVAPQQRAVTAPSTGTLHRQPAPKRSTGNEGESGMESNAGLLHDMTRGRNHSLEWNLANLSSAAPSAPETPSRVASTGLAQEFQAFYASKEQNSHEYGNFSGQSTGTSTAVNPSPTAALFHHQSMSHVQQQGGHEQIGVEWTGQDFALAQAFMSNPFMSEFQHHLQLHPMQVPPDSSTKLLDDQNTMVRAPNDMENQQQQRSGMMEAVQQNGQTQWNASTEMNDDTELTVNALLNLQSMSSPISKDYQDIPATENEQETTTTQ